MKSSLLFLTCGILSHRGCFWVLDSRAGVRGVWNPHPSDIQIKKTLRDNNLRNHPLTAYAINGLWTSWTTGCELKTWQAHLFKSGVQSLNNQVDKVTLKYNPVKLIPCSYPNNRQILIPGSLTKMMSQNTCSRKLRLFLYLHIVSLNIYI